MSELRSDTESAVTARTFDGVPIACIATRRGGGIREANARAGELLGVPAAFMVDKPLIAFVARADTRRFREALRAAKPVDALTIRMRPRRRPVIVVTLSAVPVDDGRRPVGMRWFLHLAAANDGQSSGGSTVGPDPQSGVRLR